MQMTKHLIECRLTTGTRYFHETDGADTFADVVENILSGQVEDIIRVFSVSEDGTQSDVSYSVGRAVASKAENTGRALTRHASDFIEDHCGYAMVRDLEVLS